MPDNVITIGSGVFINCAALTNVVIPSSVTSIGDSVFRNCTNLTSVTIPDSVMSIGDYAFYFNLNLIHVIIGNSVISIGDSAFRQCIKLATVQFKGNAPTTVEENAFADVASGCKTIVYPNATGFPTEGELWNGLIVEIAS